MLIAIPREIKPLEGRVGLVPAACADLIAAGHEVFLQSGAGELSGYGDDAYTRVGVQLKPDAAQLYAAGEMIVKVKEPVDGELDLLREHHLLFCFLHLAANRPLQDRLAAIGLTAIAFETVEESGALPLLAPMSNIAGRLAVQIGTSLLHQPQGGKGILLGGLPGVTRGHVVILGAGAAGGNAAVLAAGAGARVTVFDRDGERLEKMRRLGPNVDALYSYEDAIRAVLPETDLLVGAVLVTGARSPHLVDRAMVAGMEEGSVLVDVSVDQGGCIETTRPTTYAEPTYREEGVTHFCVTNMPGAVPRTASQALSAVVLPYALRLAAGNWEVHKGLSKGVNVRGGAVVHPALSA